MDAVQTVTGPCPPSELGVTLVHEHLMIGWPGWEVDEAPRDAARRRARVARCRELMLALREAGVGTVIDPCPIDLGRDVELMAEVAESAGVRIVCATGLYKEDQGASSYFRFRAQFADVAAEIADLFVRELTEGIAGSGIRPGVIKVATGAGRITDYEEAVLRAAARAHRATGVPITTHTEEGTLGPEQLAILASEGVPAQAVIVGHSCGSGDLAYHLGMLERGAYLGFDRFGLEPLRPDSERRAALVALVERGFAGQIVLSHDTVWCWRGREVTIVRELLPDWHPLHLFEKVIPALREAGVGEADIRAMLVENPCRYFTRAAPAGS